MVLEAMLIRRARGLLLLSVAGLTACSAPAGLAADALTKAKECEFPPEATQKGIDSAVATLQVTVAPNGVALGVRILDDPGSGFARVAARCVMEQIYTPALDKHGTPYTAETPPLNVRFMR